MFRRGEVGRYCDKAFRNLIHDFWTLIVIKHSVEDGLYPRKKRIPIGHIFGFRVRRVQSPSAVRTAKRAHQAGATDASTTSPTDMSTAMTFRKIPLPLSQLSLAAVLQCGQSFRWSVFPLAAPGGQGEEAQPGQPSHEYRLCLRDRVICLRQSQEALLWDAVFPNTPASPEDTVKRDTETLEWINDYFQLKVDLKELYQTWSDRDPIFHGLQERFSGIRILRQDPWENLISYVVFVSYPHLVTT